MRKGEAKRGKTGVTWFNPPYSLNVETNVGRIFLKLLDTHFPPGHILRSVMNRNKVKVSYRCLPNMGSIIAKHNSKILRENSNQQARDPPKCNCQKTKKADCPIPGACNQNGVIYQATISSRGGANTQTYVGLAKKFKPRYSKHKSSMTDPTPQNSNTLSSQLSKRRNCRSQPNHYLEIPKNKCPLIQPSDRHLQTLPL